MTDQPTDGRTNKAGCRVACTRLKMLSDGKNERKNAGVEKAKIQRKREKEKERIIAVER